MIADILLVIVALIALIVASLIDIKTKEVPDWLNFALIVIALGIRLIHSITYSEWMYFLYGLMGFGAMFLLGVGIYYTKQWGGGDTKLLMGLGAVFATKPYFIKDAWLIADLPFLVVLLINLLFIGAIYGLVWSLFLFVRNRKKVKKEFVKIFLEKKSMRFTYLILAILSLIPLLLFKTFEMRVVFIATPIFLFSYPYFFLGIKAVENVGMLKTISPDKLVEGDWVVKEVKVKGKIICGPKDPGIEMKQIEALKKAKVKKVLIKEGIAFVPSIFLGTLITLILGNFMLFLL